MTDTRTLTARPPQSGSRHVDAPSPTSRRSLPRAVEGLFVVLGSLVMSYLTLPAIQARNAAFYQDVLVNATVSDRAGVAELLSSGVLPTWVRLTYGGEPYAANLQHTVFYPGAAPFLFLPTSTAFDATVVLHLALGALGMWAYCRIGLRTGTAGALVAAMGFAFGGHMLQHIVLGGQLHVIAWMPWVLFFGHMALVHGGLRWPVLTSIAIGMQFLAGHPEGWLYTVGALALYGVAWILAAPPQLGRRFVQAAVRLGGAVVLFVLLFGWQFWPAMELKGQGYRSSPAFSQQFPLPKQMGVNSLLPDFGHVLTGENVGHVGIVVVGLFALGVCSSRRDLLWVRAWLVVIAALGLVMALGNITAFYSFFYEHVSIIRGFRVPSRWLILPYLALCVGAAIGTDELLRFSVGKPRPRLVQGAAAALVLAAGGGYALWLSDFTLDRANVWPWLLAAAAGVATWVLAAFRPVPRSLLASVLLIVTAVEVANARPHAEFRQTIVNTVYDEYGPVLERIAHGDGRYVTIATAPSTAEQKAAFPVPPGLSERERDYYYVGFVERLIARPATHIGAQAETVLGRDGGLMPLRRYRDFWLNAVNSKGDINVGQVMTAPSTWDWEGLDFLAVRWFVTMNDLPPAEQAVLSSHGFRLVDSPAYLLVWERDEPPLARMVTRTRVVPDEAERAQTIGKLDLDREAIVERPVNLTDGDAGSADVTHVGNTRVRVSTSADSRQLLVLSDPYYPGWQARIDGKPAEVLVVDGAFRGVVVPAGNHKVEFVFVARMFRLGLLSAGLTVLGLLIGWQLWPRLRSRSHGLSVRSAARTEPAA